MKCRSGTAVSANTAAIRVNTGRFSHWGNNYAYHMGDLSVAALSGHRLPKVQAIAAADIAARFLADLRSLRAGDAH